MWVGDPIDKWELVVYSDADLAGDRETSKSTTGVFLCVRAKNTFIPLQGISKRQSCVSHSTPEADIVAADHAIRMEALPALQLWERLTGRSMQARLMEDNAAAITVIKTGRNPTMRRLQQTHRINLDSLHEAVVEGRIVIEHCPTKVMCADIFTKSSFNAHEWDRVVTNIACRNDKDVG
jgi:hypothetical protein